MKRSRILLADEHFLTLEGLRKVLEPHHEVVGAVSDGRSLVDAALRLKPDIIIIRIITESGLRVYKELMGMKKEQVDLENAMVWIPDSKTPNGIAEVPLTELALEAFRDQIRISGPGPWLFPSDENPSGHQKTLKTVWHAALRRAKVVFPDIRSSLHVRDPPERGWRGGRVGDSTAPAGGRPGV